jgi:hypothetical protein
MANVEVIGDQDNPTSLITKTRSGQEIDLNNLPGRTKLRLIQADEMGIDQFISPPNMPGHKLKAIRDAHRERVGEQLKAVLMEKTKDFVVGDFVSFRGGSYEVLKVRQDGVMINMKLNDDAEFKNVWIPKAKIKKG